jgi:hypothetical protein
MSTGKRKRTPLTTTIVASKWARGGKRGNKPTDDFDFGRIAGTTLLNDDGTMCCLGFDAVQRQLKPNPGEIAMPSELVSQDKKYAASWLKTVPNKVAKQFRDDDPHIDPNDSLETAAVEINDDTSFSDDERIAKLRPIFAAVNPPRRIVWLKNK